MVSLLGQRDELLRLVEDAFPVGIHVRGNEITVTGEAAEADRVGRLFEELVLLLEAGHTIDRENLGRTIDMMKADQRPSDVLNTAVLRGRKTVRPKTAGQKRYVDAIREQVITFGIGPAGTGKTYLAMALAVAALHGHVRDRAGRDRQDLPRDGARRRCARREAGLADHPHPTRGRGR